MVAEGGWSRVGESSRLWFRVSGGIGKGEGGGGVGLVRMKDVVVKRRS